MVSGDGHNTIFERWPLFQSSQNILSMVDGLIDLSKLIIQIGDWSGCIGGGGGEFFDRDG